MTSPLSTPFPFCEVVGCKERGADSSSRTIADTREPLDVIACEKGFDLEGNELDEGARSKAGDDVEPKAVLTVELRDVLRVDK